VFEHERLYTVNSVIAFVKDTGRVSRMKNIVKVMHWAFPSLRSGRSPSGLGRSASVPPALSRLRRRVRRPCAPAALSALPVGQAQAPVHLTLGRRVNAQLSTRRLQIKLPTLAGRFPAPSNIKQDSIFSPSPSGEGRRAQRKGRKSRGEVVGEGPGRGRGGSGNSRASYRHQRHTESHLSVPRRESIRDFELHLCFAPPRSGTPT
jgi:hypothetical protein